MTPSTAAYLHRTADRLVFSKPTPLGIHAELVDISRGLDGATIIALAAIDPEVGWKDVATALRDLAGHEREEGAA